MEEKNTRLIYTDEEHIKMYEAIPEKQFKELFLAIIKYHYGDDDFVNTIQDPMVRALFLAEKPKIDFNEKKWKQRAKANAENGKKGGRPPKVKQEKQVNEVVLNPNDKMVSEEDLEKLYMADVIDNSGTDVSWRLREMIRKYGLTQEAIKEQYIKYKEYKLTA